MNLTTASIIKQSNRVYWVAVPYASTDKFTYLTSSTYKIKQFKTSDAAKDYTRDIFPEKIKFLYFDTLDAFHAAGVYK